MVVQHLFLFYFLTAQQVIVNKFQPICEAEKSGICTSLNPQHLLQFCVTSFTYRQPLASG